MKHILIAAVLMLALVGVAHAQRSSDDTGFDDKNLRQEREEKLLEERTREREQKSDDRGAMLEEKREALRETNTERREELRQRFDEFKKARMENLMDITKRRFSWAIERLENIAGRVETRIETLEDDGEDMTRARTHLADARVHIRTASAELAAIDTDISSIVRDESAADLKWTSVRQAFEKVKMEIRSAHEDLVLSINLIKGLRFNSDRSNSDSQ